MPICPCTKPPYHSGELLRWHLESDFKWHLVKVEVGEIYENIAVSNTAQAFEGVTRWLGMDKDILLYTKCIKDNQTQLD